MSATVLVCGGRDYADRERLFVVLEALHESREFGPFNLLIHGAARGADTLAEEWARETQIPFDRYPADWKRHGRAAGPLRNAKMIADGQPGLVVAFGGGKGTDDMVRRARKADVPVLEYDRERVP